MEDATKLRFTRRVHWRLIRPVTLTESAHQSDATDRPGPTKPYHLYSQVVTAIVAAQVLFRSFPLSGYSEVVGRFAWTRWHLGLISVK